MVYTFENRDKAFWMSGCGYDSEKQIKVGDIIKKTIFSSFGLIFKINATERAMPKAPPTLYDLVSIVTA